jgi:hypothetical protein
VKSAVFAIVVAKGKTDDDFVLPGPNTVISWPACVAILFAVDRYVLHIFY